MRGTNGLQTVAMVRCGALGLGLLLSGCASTMNLEDYLNLTGGTGLLVENGPVGRTGKREREVIDSVLYPWREGSFRQGQTIVIGSLAGAAAGRAAGAGLASTLSADPRAVNDPDNVRQLIESAEQYNGAVSRALEQLFRKGLAATTTAESRADIGKSAARLAGDITHRKHQRAIVLPSLRGSDAGRYELTIRMLDELGKKVVALRKTLHAKNQATLAAQR